MHSQTIYLVDSFTNTPFRGNPAAVCVLESPASEVWMKLVARELNLSETAFVSPNTGFWNLRWFTPTVEVDLCGHATLASASALWHAGLVSTQQAIRFSTRSGLLICERHNDGIRMDFPARTVEPCEAPDYLNRAIGCDYVFCGKAGEDLLVEIADPDGLRQMQPDQTLLCELPYRGTIVTSRSDQIEYDFLSRFFAPGVGIAEDPVTGSAHCALGPYWKGKLGKSKFDAFQASARGGKVCVEIHGERVKLSGSAVLMGVLQLFSSAE